MDRQRNQGIQVWTVSYTSMMRMLIYYFMTACFVLITNIVKVPKPIVLMEGAYFYVAYYLLTLDGKGACKMIMGHVASSVAMFTRFRIVSVWVLTYFSTVYPIFSIYTSMMVVFRLMMYESSLKVLFTTDRAACFHIFLLLAFISYYYCVHFTHRSPEDRVMYIVVLLTAYSWPNVSELMVAFLFMAVCLWVENKGLRFAPLRTLDVRPLDSEHFFT